MEAKKNKPLILVIGKSGSGKNYIVDKICDDFSKKNTISRTTRKPRYEGEKGHLFVSNEQADKEFSNAIAKTIFCGNRYYTLKEDLDKSDIYIIDRDGVYSMQNSNIDFITVYLKVSLINRIKNMRKRGDKVLDIFKRVINDFFMFRGFKGDIELTNNEDLYLYFKNRIL